MTVYVAVAFEGRFVVLVHTCSCSRINCMVVRTEHHTGLQVGKELLGETADLTAVMEGLGMLDLPLLWAVEETPLILKFYIGDIQYCEKTISRFLPSI